MNKKSKIKKKKRRLERKAIANGTWNRKRRNVFFENPDELRERAAEDRERTK